jgi:4a-hydroxytetrahydrobiopterin dehydratase
MSVPKLTDPEITEALQLLPAWYAQNGKLHREFKFASFVQAFGFMTMAALEIEKMNHHPEWLNVYNKVSVDLCTHDSGGITQNDIDLANLLDQIAATLA